MRRRGRFCNGYFVCADAPTLCHSLSSQECGPKEACCYTYSGRGFSHCENTWTSREYCGGCPYQLLQFSAQPTTCAVGAQCATGICECPGTTTVCGRVGDGGPGECVDVQTNSDHCGRCGATCAANQECDGGTCDCQPRFVCNGGCVDGTTDPQNCGGCGITCGSGACANAECQPVPAFRADSNIGGFSIVGSTVYWVAPSGNAVRSALLDGGAQRIIAAGQNVLTGAIAADEERICWSTYVTPLTGIQCAPLDGGSVVIAAANVLPQQLALFSGTLYWRLYEQVIEQPLDGGASRSAWPTQVSAIGPDDEGVLLSELDGGRVVRLTPSGSEVIVASHAPVPGRLAGAAGRRYLWDGAGLVEVNAGDAGVRILTGGGSFLGLHATDAGVFWPRGTDLLFLPR